MVRDVSDPLPLRRQHSKSLSVGPPRKNFNALQTLNSANNSSPLYLVYGNDEVQHTLHSPDTFAEYGEYLRRELPPMVRRKLDSIVDGELGEPLRRRIVEFVQEVHFALLQAFQQSQTQCDSGGSKTEQMAGRAGVSPCEVNAPSEQPPNLFRDLDIDNLWAVSGDLFDDTLDFTEFVFPDSGYVSQGGSAGVEDPGKGI